MCDYSLQDVASRPAKVGDKLVTSQFTGAFSRGFASVDAPKSEYGRASEAVCVLPGTEIGFDAEIVKHPQYSQEEPRAMGHSVGIFRQIDTDNKYSHHDALELPDGTHVKLNDLSVGQAATVLQLPAAPKTEAEAEAQKRLEVVG